MRYDKKEQDQNFLANDMENPDIEIRNDHIFFNNPVLIQGMGLATLIVPAVTLKNAAILSIMVCLILTPTRIIASVLARKTKFSLKAIIYTITASVIYAGAAYILSWMFDRQAISAVGVYIPLLVVEPLIIKKHNSMVQETVLSSFKKGIQITIGYSLIIFFVAFIRELMGFGTIGHIKVFSEAWLPFLTTPAGGFLLLGIIAAIWKAITLTAYRNMKKGIRFKR